MSDNQTLEVIANEIKHVSTNMKELKDEFRDQRKENADWRNATEAKLKADFDHYKVGVDAKLAAIPPLLEKKADAKEVSFLQKIVFGACAIILVAVLGAVVGLVVLKTDHKPASVPAAVVQQVNPPAR